MKFLSLNAEQKDILRARGIVFDDFTIGDDVGGLFADCWMEALGALGLVASSTGGQTPYVGITKIHATPAPPPPARKPRIRKPKAPVLTSPPSPPAAQFPVTTYAWEESYEARGGRDLMVQDIREILSPVIQKRIKASASGGSPRGYISALEGSVGLHLGEGEMTEDYTKTTFLGVRLERRYHLFRPTLGEGVILYDEETPYAQIYPDQIWILVNLGVYGTYPDERRLFQAILRNVAAEWGLSPEQRVERDRLRREKQRPANKAAYTKACAQRIRRTVEQAQAFASSGEEQVQNLQRQLVAKVRESMDAKRRVPLLEAQIGQEAQLYGAEFDKLLATPHVIDVDIVGGTKIRVFTDVLYCVDPRSKKRHEIGAFRIEISLGDDPLVRWFNLTRQVVAFDGQRCQAPHVFAGGRPCLGNVAEVFPALVAAYEFAAAAQVAIAFIQQVNTDDVAGSYISRWPLAPEGEEGAVTATTATPPAVLSGETADSVEDEDGDEDNDVEEAMFAEQ